jgi:hypothetical protein
MLKPIVPMRKVDKDIPNMVVVLSEVPASPSSRSSMLRIENVQG